MHDFSRFSVSTIDSFYQKIIRAFARDIGLHSGFDIEIDHSAVLASAVDRDDRFGRFRSYSKKLAFDVCRANIEEGKNWDLKKNIIGLAGEIFAEKFKLLSSDEKKRLMDKEFLKSYIGEMRSTSSIHQQGNEGDWFEMPNDMEQICSHRRYVLPER